MPGTIDVQAEFAGALLSLSRRPPASVIGAAQGRAERRFAVYRNTVAAGLIEALRARFPVVERLVGEDFFRAMARAYVARLEYAGGLAYHAADRNPLPPAAFAALDKGRLAYFTVTLHPSVVIVASAFPILSIWLANQAETVAPLRHRGAESALVSRPYFDVETRRLQPGTNAFLSALKAGSTIGAAVASRD